jgi:SP family facilitated glucose transporter-like MFS transporter 3
VAAFAAGGPFGAIMAGGTADERGRRAAIIISAWLFLFGGALQALAPGIYIVVVARFVIGFASGFTSVVVPIYLGELAPPSARGTIGTLTQFATVLGILVADGLAFPLATNWRLMFGVTTIIAAFQLLLTPWLLESPRWILSNHGSIDESSKQKAREIIGKLKGLTDKAFIEDEVVHYISASRAQGGASVKGGGIAHLKALLANPEYRSLLISCFVLQMAQQFSGINAVFYYSNSFFTGVIDDPLVGTTLVGAVNVVATMGAVAVMESTGRRSLILWSAGGMFACTIVIVLALLGYFDQFVALAAVNLYVVFFEFGLGPIPWLIVAECFSAGSVACVMSACTLVNWACNFLVGLAFPYMQEYLGPYSFGPFAVCLLFTFIYTLIFLPETRGKTPEQLHIELATRRPVKDLHVD